ncbi:glycosyltransferase family 4 protein [Flavimaricola sp.]|nr:glycosyltransferase family 4 protein [Flavimaricola sp.]MDA9020137.1 glycosyltransferase family 4 protein [Flavimaricola sp.]
MKKVALLTKYGNQAASTRQRFLQYRSYFEAVGFEFEEQPLLDNAYLDQLYEGGVRDIRHVASRYFDRISWLIWRCDADVIWLHCELLPYLPGILERLARIPRRPIVFDFDDAIFHNYDLHPRGVVRSLLGKKLQTTIGAAELVLAGNAYLADYARLNCKCVEIVPTVVDTHQYMPSNAIRPSGSPRIGWIGTPSTWAEYMLPMLPMLSAISAEWGARVAAVGASGEEQPGIDIIPWSEETEVSLIQDMDIGLMPLTDTPWARGKCGYKLIQYMACGLPVVASPVGVNRDIVEHGVNGFLAETPDEWRQAVETLICNPELRQQMGQEGRKKVEQLYSLQVYGPLVASLLSDIAARAELRTA